jgi:tetratricopeptide (TPR) repeat protein
MNRRQRRDQATLQRPEVTAPASQPAANSAAVEADLAAATQHLQAGKLQHAQSILTRVAKAQPRNSVALHLLGVIALQTGKIEVGVDLIAKAVAFTPDFAEAHSNLGIALMNQGKLDEAVASYRKAIALAPNVAQIHNNLGGALMRRGKVDEAIHSLQTAVALAPDDAEAHYNLGNAFKKQGKLDEAVACYRKGIALNRNYAELHNNLGNALNLQGLHEEAVASYQKAIALRPNFAEAHHNLGIALKSQGKLEAALASYQKAIALRPDYAAAYNNLGFALERQGQLKAALACYQKAIALDPIQADAHYIHAMDRLFIPGDPEIEKLHKLAKLEGISKADKSPILSALGKAHDDIGRYREAFSYYSAANEEMTRQGDFDPSGHRKEISEIKEMFRERRDPADQNAGDAEHVPVFVVGMSRSGKTSVESLLTQHEDVYGADESREWEDAVNAVLDKYSISTSFPEYVGFLSDDQTREIGEIYMENMIRISSDSKLFINTSPGNYQFIGMIRQALPMAKIIYCHRDPMDHCLFVYFYRYESGHDYSYDLSHLASYYVDYIEMMVHWQKLHGDRILSVRYEDLVRNPADVGARIYAFCGLDFDPAAIRHAFTTDEIGHWKHYEPYLGTLRQALGGLAQ